MALLVVGVIRVFHGALNFYFAQEDFRGLAVAAGVYPRHAQIWRYLSIQTFMDVFYPFFRARAWPYHLVSLALHAFNACLLFVLLRKRLRGPAALIGSSFFAAHPAHFTALYWQSARADILAASFALVTVMCALRRGKERWISVPAFALALLSKESVLTLPAGIALVDAWRAGQQTGGKPQRPWTWTTVALASMSLIYGLYLASARVRLGLESGPAYAMNFGASLLANLFTYVGWTVDIALVRPGMRFVDAQNPTVYGFAVAVLLLGGFLGLFPAMRRHGWFVALAAYFLLLIPILPLSHHTYRYYLYLPLMAAAWLLAILCDVLLQSLAQRTGRLRSPVLEWGFGWLCWMVLTWNGARLVSQMEQRPSPVYAGLRGDPIVDRALIAERAIHSLRAASIPTGTELVLMLRERLALIARIVRGSRESPPPAHEIYLEANVKAALFDGVAVRALVPSVDSVTFALTLGQPLAHRRYGVYAPTGETQVFDAVSLDSLLRSSWVTEW